MYIVVTAWRSSLCLPCSKILRIVIQRIWGVADGDYPLSAPFWDSLNCSALEPEGDPELSEPLEPSSADVFSSSSESEWDFSFSLVGAGCGTLRFFRDTSFLQTCNELLAGQLREVHLLILVI